MAQASIERQVHILFWITNNKPGWKCKYYYHQLTFVPAVSTKKYGYFLPLTQKHERWRTTTLRGLRIRYRHSLSNEEKKYTSDNFKLHLWTGRFEKHCSSTYTFFLPRTTELLIVMLQVLSMINLNNHECWNGMIWQTRRSQWGYTVPTATEQRALNAVNEPWTTCRQVRSSASGLELGTWHWQGIKQK